MRSSLTYAILEGLVPVDTLDRRSFGEPSNTPRVVINGRLDSGETPDVLLGAQTRESAVGQTPGVTGRAGELSAWDFDTGVNLAA